MIRPFRTGDAAHLPEIFRAAILQTGVSLYTETQAANWASRCPAPQDYLAAIEDGQSIWIGTDASDHPRAFLVQTQNGHIDQLYCHPEFGRRGLASQLLRIAEQHARAAEVKKLTTYASAVLRPLLERNGFCCLARRDLKIENVEIYNFEMEKRLR